tara:strand:- start:349 stop:1635 length:1287 start_codon:yes stop_codon:yes gene_type:complete
LLALLRAREALDAALAARGFRLDASGRVIPMGERYRVTTSPPRKGRDRGCWVLRVYGPGVPKTGRRELTEIPYAKSSKPRAKAAAAQRSAELNDDGRSMLSVFDDWAAERKRSGRLAEKTLRSYSVARSWLASSAAAGIIDGLLSGARVLEVREELTQTLRVGTARLYLGLIAQAWRWAHLRELVVQPWPTGLPPWRTPAEDRTRKRAYTPAELLDLLDYLAAYAGGHYLGLGWILAETAARIGAVLSLRVGDVQVLPDGSGLVAIGRRVGAGATKTKSERTGAISPALVRELRLDRYPVDWLFESRRTAGTVGAKPVPAGSFRSVVEKWLRSRGLYGLRDVHSFRRRGAAELHRANVPTEIGRRITGHASSEVFLSYASKANYDLTEERRILWVTPRAILDQSRPNDINRYPGTPMIEPSQGMALRT